MQKVREMLRLHHECGLMQLEIARSCEKALGETAPGRIGHQRNPFPVRWPLGGVAPPLWLRIRSGLGTAPRVTRMANDDYLEHWPQ